MRSAESFLFGFMAASTPILIYIAWMTWRIAEAHCLALAFGSSIDRHESTVILELVTKQQFLNEFHFIQLELRAGAQDKSVF
jgi:hypothetical protein